VCFLAMNSLYYSRMLCVLVESGVVCEI
jgi:hypothetical protein